MKWLFLLMPMCAFAGPPDLPFAPGAVPNADRVIGEAQIGIRRATPEPKLEPVTNWAVHTWTSPLYDTCGVALMNPGHLPEEATPSHRLILSIRHDEGSTEVYLSSADDFFWDDHHLVIVRFGNEKPENQVWSESTDHHGLFSRSPRDFIWRALGCQRITIRCFPAHRDPVTMIYETEGLRPVLAEHEKEFRLVESTTKKK